MTLHSNSTHAHSSKSENMLKIPQHILLASNFPAQESVMNDINKTFVYLKQGRESVGDLLGNKSCRFILVHAIPFKDRLTRPQHQP